MITRRITLIFIGALAAAVMSAAFFLFLRAAPEVLEKKEFYASAPETILKDLEGKDVSLSGFRGRAVLLNSWASWCPFCLDELSHFADLQKEFGEKIAVIAVNRKETPEIVNKFSERTGLAGKILFLLDPSDSFYSSIGGFSMPETVFVDEAGFIKDHKRGPMNWEDMRRRTKRAFNL